MSRAPAIAIVDANNFYVSCERIFNPALEGRPVVVLSNNDGCVISRSNEAKQLDINMAAPWHEIAGPAEARGVIALSSNYELYGDMSARSAEILSRFTPSQEIYSIDESFIQLSPDVHAATVAAREIRRTMRRLIGLPVSIGISSSKTLAKLANRGSKSSTGLNGVCHFGAYSPHHRTAILESVATKDVWGVGSRSTTRLAGMGITTAAHLRDSDAASIRRAFSVVMERTVHELRGIDCLPLEEERSAKDRIQYSRSFAHPISTVAELDEVLTVYTQRAAARLRQQGSLARALHGYASTSPFKDEHVTHAVSLSFPEPTDDPVEMRRAVVAALAPQLETTRRYVRVGVTLSEFSSRLENASLDLFGDREEPAVFGALLDQVAARHGQGALGLGVAGLKTARNWTMRRERVSPRATTHWDELAQVRAS